MKQTPLLIWVLLFPLLQSCQTGNSTGLAEKASGAADPEQFGKYWYQGKAEITSYSLEQARYGQIHTGESVLIFVTEDFSKKKQVKLDNPEENKKDAVNVLKLNLTKKFNTGIYPYSMMLSVFTPVQVDQYPYALKLTASAQEWCGQTFSQLNLGDKKYHFTLHSYFESEGEIAKTIPVALPEDQIWTRIRINPSSLPSGEVTLIPALLTQRLRHTQLQPQKATATLTKIEKAGKPQWISEEEKLMTYQLYYPDENRKLTIYFGEGFPHHIVGWEETYKDGFGDNAQLLTTRAIRKKRLLTDYWTKNKREHAYLRDSLGLSLHVEE